MNESGGWQWGGVVASPCLGLSHFLSLSPPPPPALQVTSPHTQQQQQQQQLPIDLV